MLKLASATTLRVKKVKIRLASLAMARRSLDNNSSTFFIAKVRVARVTVCSYIDLYEMI